MIKSPLRHINVLNLLLLAAIYILANSYLLPVRVEKTALLKTAPKNDSSQQTASEVARFQAPHAAEYSIISDQNLFHPERKIPVEKKMPQLAAKPEFVLYGTLISDTVAIAYMEDRKVDYSSPGRGNRQHAVMLGTSLSNYTLAEIYHDRVLMVRGEDRIEVRIADIRPSRGKTPQVTGAPAPKEKKDPISILEKKTAGSGLPPGVIIKDMPPELKDKVPAKLEDTFREIFKQQKLPK
jgi:hypothetical protein